MDQKILDKIRKVLALAKSTYQEEAQAALLKAQELMVQHGLTMAEVQQDNIQDKQVVDTCISEKRRNTWYEKSLSAVIGENFRCHSYVHLGQGIYFIGLKEDVEIAREIYFYALNTMLYLANEYVKTHRRGQVTDSWSIRGIKNDYISGFINGLQDKFKKQVENKDYSLILVKDALVVQAVNNKKLKKGRKNQHISAGSFSAFNAGYKDGHLFDENQKLIR